MLLEAPRGGPRGWRNTQVAGVGRKGPRRDGMGAASKGVCQGAPPRVAWTARAARFERLNLMFETVTSRYRRSLGRWLTTTMALLIQTMMPISSNVGVSTMHRLIHWIH